MARFSHRSGAGRILSRFLFPAFLAGAAAAAGPGIEGFRVPADFFDAPIAARAGGLAPDTVVCRVNGEPVTVAEWNREIQGLLRTIGDRIPAAQRDAVLRQVRDRALDNLVVRKLLHQDADREGLAVSADRVREEVARIESQIPEGRSLDDELRAQGIRREDLDREIEASLRIARLLEMKSGDHPPVGEEELARFYESHPAEFVLPERAVVRHILIRFDESDNEAARRRKRAEASALIRALGRGSEFAQMAASRSDCAQSRERGGLLGVVARGQQGDAFEDAVFTREVGAVGPAVESPLGLHILRVDERMPPQSVSFEAARERIREHLAGLRRQEAVARYVSGLRENAVIETAEEAAAP